MLIEQTQAELNAAQLIQSGCTLMRVVLAKSSVEAFGTEEQFPGPLKLKFTHEATSALNGQVLTVMAHFDFKSFVASDDIVPVFDLACTFQLAYELQENCKPTPQQVDAFKKGNAVYNCWPYVREFVQNLTARMGFQPPPLPLLGVKVKNEVPPKPTDKATEGEQPSTAQVGVNVDPSVPALPSSQ
jgi:hypothetical protein